MSVCVVILTFNEEKHVQAAITSAKQIAEQIIVLDSGSTDQTVKIAQAAGAEVIYRAWDNDFSSQRNFARGQAKTTWIFYLDADERITPELATEIKKLTQPGQAEKLYTVRRENIVFGKKFHYGVFRPDKVKRLVPALLGEWRGRVHENLHADLPNAQLSGSLIHYPYESWEQYFSKFNKYTSLWAEEALAREKKTSRAGAFAHAIFSFFKVTFFNLGFLDGIMGLVMCSFHFMYTLAKYLKLYQLQSIEQQR